MMDTPLHPKNDPRSVHDLVNFALTESDEDTAWQAVCALHWRGSREVLLRAEELSRSQCSQERTLAADILGQLGVPDRMFPKECCNLLRKMLLHTEKPDVLNAVLFGLYHQNDVEAVPLVISFSRHPDPKVRHAVVLALTGHETPVAIECLITLSSDVDAHVRDWATFALGIQIELDTPAIREALVNRLDDPDDDTRGEALVGLALRKDERVIHALKAELSSQSVGTLAIEAAEAIASTELHSHLVSLREWWDVHPELLERAISVSQS